MAFSIVQRNKKRGIFKESEQSLHLAVAQFLDAALPKDAVWCHPANGGYRTPFEAQLFPRLGVKCGMPDILVFWNKQFFGIELKSEDGRLTIDQVGMHARLRLAGMAIETCRSISQVKRALESWNVALRSVRLSA